MHAKQVWPGGVSFWPLNMAWRRPTSRLPAGQSSSSLAGHVLALRSSDGSLAWAHETGMNFSAGVMFSGGLVYTATVHPQLHALNASTGASRWRVHQSLRHACGIPSTELCVVSHILPFIYHVALLAGWDHANTILQHGRFHLIVV